MEVSSVVTWGAFVKGPKTTKAHRELSEVMNIFYVLTVVLDTFIKTYELYLCIKKSKVRGWQWQIWSYANMSSFLKGLKTRAVGKK